MTNVSILCTVNSESEGQSSADKGLLQSSTVGKLGVSRVEVFSSFNNIFSKVLIKIYEGC